MAAAADAAAGSPVAVLLAQAQQLDAAPTAPPTAHGGWLWRWDDGASRWSRLWCVLQGRALLCYAEAYMDVDGGLPT